MSLKDLVAGAKKSAPALENMPDARAVALLREVFRGIGAQIEGTSDGVVKVPGLGNFRVKMVEKEKDGQKTQVKRVIFKEAAVKAGAAAGKPKGKGKA
jgi:hypothetical protein